jgi:hypothetical protein
VPELERDAFRELALNHPELADQIYPHVVIPTTRDGWWGLLAACSLPIEPFMSGAMSCRDVLAYANVKFAPPPNDQPSSPAKPETIISPQRNDGPEGGSWVHWQGKRHDVPKGVVYRLITHMWTRQMAYYSSLDGPVFEGAVLPNTMRARACEVNKVLNKIGIPWRLRADAIGKVLTKDQVE